MNIYRLLADLIVVVHVAYVGFVVLGLFYILLGLARGWQSARNFWFRAVHLAMIAVVALEAMLGITCPLTNWEHHLRIAAGETPAEGSFLGRLAHDLLFYENVPQWVFSMGHILFGVAVLAAYLLAPPRLPGKHAPGQSG